MPKGKVEGVAPEQPKGKLFGEMSIRAMIHSSLSCQERKNEEERRDACHGDGEGYEKLRGRGAAE
jgi:hypothetical protein